MLLSFISVLGNKVRIMRPNICWTHVSFTVYLINRIFYQQTENKNYCFFILNKTDV